MARSMGSSSWRWRAAVLLGLASAVAAVAGVGLLTVEETSARAEQPAEVGGKPALTGLLNAQERGKAAAALQRNPAYRELTARYGGTLSDWAPAELEGEARGAVAYLSFAKPVRMNAPVIRPAGLPGHEEASAAAGAARTRVEDYRMESTSLPDEVVERYVAVIDLPTGAVVILAPSPPAPKLGEPPAAVRAKSDNGGPTPAAPVTGGR